MKLIPLLLPILGFGSAFGATLWWERTNQTLAATPASVASAKLSAYHPSGNRPAINVLSDGKAGTPVMTPPAGPDDEKLLALCRERCGSDPAAAFRAGMAAWKWDRQTLDALYAAAEALVKKDPDEARRLLAECPDLRSRSLLESFIMADEVGRHPRETLAWAEQNLKGNVRLKALISGIKALADIAPGEALAFVAGLPPGYTKLNGSTVSLAAQLKQDSDACLAWITENILPAKREQTGFLLCLAYLKNNPAENGYDLLPKLPLELQLPMLRTLANQYASSPGRSLPMVLETIQALPDGLQVEAIRSMAAELKRKPDEPGKSRTAFLALLTQPDQRAAAVEAIAAQELVFYERNATEPWPFLSELKTTQDKQSAARVVAYIMYLTETQRLEILHRLK